MRNRTAIWNHKLCDVTFYLEWATLAECWSKQFQIQKKSISWSVLQMLPPTDGWGSSGRGEWRRLQGQTGHHQHTQLDFILPTKQPAGQKQRKDITKKRALEAYKMMQQQGKTQYRKLKLVKSLTVPNSLSLSAEDNPALTLRWKRFSHDLCTEVVGECEGLLLALSANIQQVTIVQWTLKLISPDTLSHTFK